MASKGDLKEDLLSKPWFHGKVSREEIEQRMKDAGCEVGMYLVWLRESGASKNHLVLSVAYGMKGKKAKPTHHLLNKSPSDGCYLLNKKIPTKSTTIERVLEYLKQPNYDGWRVVLTTPVDVPAEEMERRKAEKERKRAEAAALRAEAEEADRKAKEAMEERIRKEEEEKHRKEQERIAEEKRAAEELKKKAIRDKQEKARREAEEIKRQQEEEERRVEEELRAVEEEERRIEQAEKRENDISHISEGERPSDVTKSADIQREEQPGDILTGLSMAQVLDPEDFRPALEDYIIHLFKTNPEGSLTMRIIRRKLAEKMGMEESSISNVEKSQLKEIVKAKLDPQRKMKVDLVVKAEQVITMDHALNALSAAAAQKKAAEALQKAKNERDPEKRYQHAVRARKYSEHAKKKHVEESGIPIPQKRSTTAIDETERQKLDLAEARQRAQAERDKMEKIRLRSGTWSVNSAPKPLFVGYDDHLAKCEEWEGKMHLVDENVHKDRALEMYRKHKREARERAIHMREERVAKEEAQRALTRQKVEDELRRKAEARAEEQKRAKFRVPIKYNIPRRRFANPAFLRGQTQSEA